MDIKKYRNYYYLGSFEFVDAKNKIINRKIVFGDRIWHEVSLNANLDVVQYIYSLNGIKDKILNEEGKKYNPFLIACEFNSNIKVIKYIHKSFPSFINSQTKFNKMSRNAAYLVLGNSQLETSDKLKIFHYLYLNGINIHLLIMSRNFKQIFFYRSVYSSYCKFDMIKPYLKVISQDFDYLHNEHDDKAYEKPFFWKEIDNNNNHGKDKQSKGVNEWKNRFEEHVIRKLSKMIQQYMLKQKRYHIKPTYNNILKIREIKIMIDQSNDLFQIRSIKKKRETRKESRKI